MDIIIIVYFTLLIMEKIPAKKKPVLPKRAKGYWQGKINTMEKRLIEKNFKPLVITSGLREKRLIQKIRDIEKKNKTACNILTIYNETLQGIESDIKNG